MGKFCFRNSVLLVFIDLFLEVQMINNKKTHPPPKKKGIPKSKMISKYTISPPLVGQMLKTWSKTQTKKSCNSLKV